MSNIIQQPTQPVKEPYNWSRFDRTYNDAIDLVAQAVGYHRKAMKPLKAIKLKPSYFYLFQTGVQAIMKHKKMKYDEGAVLMFDGVEITMGSELQFDSMLFEFHSTVPEIIA